MANIIMETIIEYNIRCLINFLLHPTRRLVK